MSQAFDCYPHPSALPIQELERLCKFEFLKRSGPGGQHRNKKSTAVIVRLDWYKTQAEANEERSQAANREVALKRLRLILALNVRRTDLLHLSLPNDKVKAPPGAKSDDDNSITQLSTSSLTPHLSNNDATPYPSQLWIDRSRHGRINVNTNHFDFPSLLAEALDCIIESGLDFSKAGETMRVSGTQLVNLLKQFPPAIQKINELRYIQGLHPLK